MDKYERDREGLIKKLLESVKQCQVDFGGKSILASEKDSSVSCLVAQFEQAFQHGLKKNKMWEMISSYVEPVRQITDKMLLEIDLTFWSVVKEYLGISELNYFNTLPDITTDSGKARVWLRTAINESTLERQLLLILGNVALLKQFYEPWALFIDGERSSIIPVMARGLASIVFAIDVKNSSLNRPFKQISVPNGSIKSEKVASKTHRRVNSSPMLQQCIAEPSIMKKINMKKKKKKRAVSAEITDLDDGSNLYSDSSRTESSSYTENTYCSYITANMLSKNSSTNQIQTHRRKASAPNSQTIFNTSQFEDLKNFSIKDSHLINSENIIDNKENNVRSCIQKKGCNVELKTETKEMVQTLCTKNSFEQKDKIGNLKDSNNSEETRPRTGDVVSDDILNVKEFELKVGYEDNENYTKGSFVPENDDVFEKNFQVSLTKLNSGEKQPGKKHYQLENLEKYEVDNERKISIENQEQKSLVTKNFYGKNTENVSFEIKSSPECIESFIPYDEISTRAASDMLPLLVCSNIDKVFPVYQLPEEEKNLKGSFGELLTKELPQDAPESLSIDDLKQAVLATVKKKDDVEQKNLDLQRALDEERNINRCLKNDLECATIKIREKEDTIEKKLTETLQENEILKNQLKKYVAAVKMLKKENGFTIDFIDGYEVVDVPTNNKNDTYDTYEEKLSQMAELHGELMEFQEHLQKQLISQDNQISRMKQELVSLRGPLPIDLLPSSTSAYFFIKNYFTPNRLVSILVPSVFLKRKGTESHHLYQVYTRIGEEEWNVYRRYSQFNKLRTHVSKMNLKTLEKFDFPKKNVFGKKDTKFLEERRLRLQEYLRTVINACISAHLSIDNSKQDLINHIPFFGENFCDDNQNKL